MNLRTIVLLGAVAAALAAGSDSLANDPEGNNPAIMASIHGRFDLLDTNKDGKVCRKEYVKFHMKLARERFDRMDKNNNGCITRKEADEIGQAAGKSMEKMKNQWQQWQQKQQQQKQQP